MTLNNDRERIGLMVSAIRQSKGLSLRQLSELTGLDHSNIGKIERGRYNVSIDILSRLCEAMGCEVTIIKKAEE